MTLADAAARATIREALDATLVVEAAAGTGKTTEMIARMLAVIRTGATTLERIVAVTFTEKAAGELKLRLRTELERARQASAGVERARFEGALAELEVARVGTIHAFCADLLRERPIEAGIDPLFEVAAEDAAERLYAQAFDAWFQGCLGAPGEGVRRILRRDDPTALLRRAGRSAIERRDFDGAWRRDPFDRAAAIDHVVAELAALGGLASRAERSNDYLAELLGELERWIAELGRRELVQGRDHDGLEAELGRVAKWWRWKYAGRSTQFGAGLLRADVVAQRDAVKAELDRVVAAAGADLAACLHAELRPLVAAYERLKARTGQLDFLDLLVRARDLLRDDPAIRDDLQRRFSHFFVDEFQDTDPLQVEILMLLCAGDPAIADPARVTVRPGKLFVVGDPKQAIYRFRRADIALYEDVKRRLLGQGATLVHLTTSFRAVASIQSLVNAAFAPVMCGDGQAEYVALARHRDDLAGQPAIVALPVPAPYGRNRKVTNAAIEASYPDAVAAFVAQLVTELGWKVSVRGSDTPVAVAPRHVCLVLRRFQAFGRDLTRPYVRALEAHGIPHVLVGGRSFHGREEIEAMRNAIAAIEWPDDQLSVYATLRGPLFALHDEDLVAFQHAHGRLHPMAWLDADRVAHGSAALRDVAEALSILGGLHRARNRRPIADTIARLLAVTRAHAGLALWPTGEQALANVVRVMDLARRFEAGGATSFRAFVERIEADAERGKQPDAPVVEEGTDGVRIMTAHAAKGLEFPVVILCDPTAPLGPERPSRHIDPARRVWLEPLAGCVPAELAEREAEVVRRDREEGERLAYVAATRARDLLVVPVVGDEERPGWLAALTPAVSPAVADRRTPRPAPGCPAFGADSVVTRPLDAAPLASACVAPGQHAPRAGAHAVVWWDPHALALGRDPGRGLRHLHVLQVDEAGVAAAASERAHAAWQDHRQRALDRGAAPSLAVQTITQAARDHDAGAATVAIIEARAAAAGRPSGKRFGALVHAALAAIDLSGDAGGIPVIVEHQARVVGASRDELDAAVVAIRDAVAHPLLVRAAAAAARGALRREVPVVVRRDGGVLEGVVDLAFAEPGDDGEVWTVVELKTDAELGRMRDTYLAQVRLYADAIATATGRPATPVLFVI